MSNVIKFLKESIAEMDEIIDQRGDELDGHDARIAQEAYELILSVIEENDCTDEAFTTVADYLLTYGYSGIEVVSSNGEKVVISIEECEDCE